MLPILLSAAIYWLAGKLALLMAIPPGYATAVWPAAGLALVCVLFSGNRVALGVALGSFLVNIGTSFETSTTATTVRSIAVALGIAGGAACQSIVGATLIRRFIGFPTPLEGGRHVTRFIVLGGPVSCLLSPTIGVGVLCGLGIVPWDNYAFSWWTWWVGDTIGVLIFAPLALLFLPSPYPIWQRRRAIVGVQLLGGLAVVTLLFLRTSAWEEARLRAEFERRAMSLSHSLEERLSEYHDVVSFIGSLFEASVEVTRNEFTDFVRPAWKRYPGVLALGWNPHVDGAERNHYEEAARSDGISGFEFTERDARGELRRAATRASYTPVYYLEPHNKSRAILGYDLASDAIRNEALLTARRTKALSATSRLTLLRETRGRYSVLLLAPVFTHGDSSAPPQLRGYASGVFRIADVVESALRGLDRVGIDVSLFDEDAPEKHRFLFSTMRMTSNASNETAMRARGNSREWSSTVDFGGRRWKVRMSATTAYMNAHRSWQAWIVLAGGLLFVGLLGAVLLVSTGQASRAQRMLEEQSRADEERVELLRQLQTLNAELETRVTERTADLSKALREREVLIREIHHRVKNNLQVISSLINMQVRKLDAGIHKEALVECQMRVQAIALIHEKLYQSDDFSSVPFSEYARTLASNIFYAAGLSPSTVSLQLDIEEVALAVDQAIPCGLILNELMTNALKHAFKDGRTGTVRVELTKVDGRKVRLTVGDDGVGLPAELDFAKSGSLGLQLVRMLSEQLGAELRVSSNGGSRFELVLPST